MDKCCFRTSSDLFQVYVHPNSVIIRIVLLLIPSLKRSGFSSVFTHHSVSSFSSSSKTTLVKSCLVASLVYFRSLLGIFFSFFRSLFVGPRSGLSWHFSAFSRDPSDERNSLLLHFFLLYVNFFTSSYSILTSSLLPTLSSKYTYVPTI